MKAWVKLSVLAGSVAAAFVLLFVALWIRKQTVDRTNHQICVAVQNINLIVTAQLRRSKQNLPKLAYFREHPDELADQTQRINEQLRAFRPRRCR